MDTTSLEAAVASLPEQDRIVIGGIVDHIGTMVAQLDKVSEALVLLDRLDDQRQAEVRALRARVRLLTMHAAGEISSQVLAETIAAVPPIMPESIRVEKAAEAGDEQIEPAGITQADVERFVSSQTAYWDEIAKLRAERERIESEQGEAPLGDLGQATFETRSPSASGRTILAEEIVPDEHGNTRITFGDGTGAVHTSTGWYEVWEEASPDA